MGWEKHAGNEDDGPTTLNDRIMPQMTMEENNALCTSEVRRKSSYILLPQIAVC